MATASRPVTPAYSLQSVRNALQIVRILQDREGMSVSDVAEELGVGMSTAHRLLSTLKLESFVQQSPSSKRYFLGPVMTATPPAHLLSDYISASREPMERLVAEVGETSHLLVRDGRVIRFLHAEETSRVLRLTSRVGMTLPVHAASGGKVLLTHLSSIELNQLFPSERLPLVVPGTIGSRAALLEQLPTVRRDGYAINIGESEEDVFAMAAPITDRNGIPVAAISLAGPVQRLNARTIMRKLASGRDPVEALKQTAAEVSRNLEGK